MILSRQEIEKRAKEVLVQHGLYTIPVDPVVLAQRLGIKVYNAKFANENLSAMIARRGESVTVLVEQSDVSFRKRFSIAHELGHHFLHLLADGEIADTPTDLFRNIENPSIAMSTARRSEVEANQFAAALLMPADLVKEAWERHRSLPLLARLFNVSESAMGIRLDTLGLD